MSGGPSVSAADQRDALTCRAGEVLARRAARLEREQRHKQSASHLSLKRLRDVSSPSTLSLLFQVSDPNLG